MGSSRCKSSSLSLCFYAIQIVFFIQSRWALCYQYKVGDLDSWGIPSSADPHVYNKWPQYHDFKIGDSLVFLYPPSQDSVIQVTAQSYNSCDLKDPILNMNDGNSLFNLTSKGVFYFISGQPGHCEKGQKLQISLPSNGSSVSDGSPSGPSTPDSSYPTVFGSIPTATIASSSSLLQKFSASTSFIGSTVLVIAYGFI
ncbi:Early nodulin-like protein [Drosera capensis]